MSIIEQSRLIEAITLENTGRRGVQDLYIAASRMSVPPLILGAAVSLHKAIEGRCNVMVASGFTMMSAGECETDGPLGSVVVGKVINEMGGHAIFLTDPQNTELFEALSRVAGLRSCRSIGFPLESDLAELEASRLVNEFAPTAIIAIERPGWNKKSIYHNMRGLDISSKTAKIDHVFSRASVNGILTIGIGDGGNEIGMGNIFQAVSQNIPFGSLCQCPCRGGIASVTRVDHLIVSSVSNWGAYGLAALLARLARLPLEHTPSDERNLIKAAVGLGAVDGLSGRLETAVDGLNLDRNAEIVEKIVRIMHH